MDEGVGVGCEEWDGAEVGIEKMVVLGEEEKGVAGGGRVMEVGK